MNNVMNLKATTNILSNYLMSQLVYPMAQLAYPLKHTWNKKYDLKKQKQKTNGNISPH